ncbi:MAG: lipoyl synthase [Bacteroidetes bacterium HGW-Bacteroidetes-17]|jgi:lipoic acid synthetase|nr:MAG: lipoyl synthase [Bacteroidetes bacterium HGW-Bacteroidetes-17]
MKTEKQSRRIKPDWLKTQIPTGKTYLGVREIVEKNKLHTICTSGNCPNMNECWGLGTATLMILGDICTRSCKFCNVKTGKPDIVDYGEPKRVADSVKLMKLKHVVLTSVDRDDLEDGGAGIWAETIKEIKKTSPETTLETLIPDFQGKKNLIEMVIDAAPEVISHNLETVERLAPQVRSVANYRRSLEVIRQIAFSGIVAKSGIMVGIGETEEEVLQCMDDLLDVGCKVFTIGQYLQPTTKHLPVLEYVHPDTFEMYKEIGLEKGFTHVESSPLVRSSYHAEKHVR